MNFKNNILVIYSPDFIKALTAQPAKIQKKAIKMEEILKTNPLHPSLRIHKLEGKLKGLWSIAINLSVRIIFKPQDNGDFLFLSIGTHAIYDK
ncbi:type II toxin-antitoxin system mRNA interferase toxin, RelE/StbE family [Candidatus Gracilibacteria bacterium]|nr:type II toxin-antitoxin system mRNA interferase toxin, RelE/StbE family [Candidatus Gracilibacteria bacterium]